MSLTSVSHPAALTVITSIPHTHARPWAITDRGISTTASFWVWAHGPAGAMATAGAVIASAVEEEDGTTAEVVLRPIVDIMLAAHPTPQQRVPAYPMPLPEPQQRMAAKHTPLPTQRVPAHPMPLPTPQRRAVAAEPAADTSNRNCSTTQHTGKSGGGAYQLRRFAFWCKCAALCGAVPEAHFSLQPTSTCSLRQRVEPFCRHRQKHRGERSTKQECAVLLSFPGASCSMIGTIGTPWPDTTLPGRGALDAISLPRPQRISKGRTASNQRQILLHSRCGDFYLIRTVRKGTYIERK